MVEQPLAPLPALEKVAAPLRKWAPMKLPRMSKAVRVAAPVIATAALTVACGSTSSSGVAGAAALNAASVAATPAASAPAAASATVTIETHSGALGSYLTNGAGRTLYLWVADTGSTSTCTGSCAGAWPPVVGAPKAAGSVRASNLATVARSDGSHQVTYDGHPLYYFVGDKAAGSTAGQGSDGFGAKWWVVSAAGTPITGSGAGASAAPAATRAKNGY